MEILKISSRTSYPLQVETVENQSFQDHHHTLPNRKLSKISPFKASTLRALSPGRPEQWVCKAESIPVSLTNFLFKTIFWVKPLYMSLLGGVWELPQSVSACFCWHQRVQWSLLFVTPIFCAGCTILMVTQAKKLVKTEAWLPESSWPWYNSD